MTISCTWLFLTMRYSLRRETDKAESDLYILRNIHSITFQKLISRKNSRSSRVIPSHRLAARMQPSRTSEIYRCVEGISIVGPSCIVSNWNIYEPINHFCCCSPPYALDTAPIGRRAPRLLRYSGMLYRGSSDFFELLGEGGRPNDSREQ